MFNGNLLGKFGFWCINLNEVLKVGWILWECFTRPKTPAVRWLCDDDHKSSKIPFVEWRREVESLEKGQKAVEVASVSGRPLLRREAHRGLRLRGRRLGGAHREARARVRVSNVLHERSVKYFWIIDLLRCLTSKESKDEGKILSLREALNKIRKIYQICLYIELCISI